MYVLLCVRVCNQSTGRNFFRLPQNLVHSLVQSKYRFKDGLCGSHRDLQGAPPKNQLYASFSTMGLTFYLKSSIDKAHQDIKSLSLRVIPQGYFLEPCNLGNPQRIHIFDVNFVSKIRMTKSIVLTHFLLLLNSKQTSSQFTHKNQIFY